MSTCTAFCQQLHGLQLQHGQLPSHDELIAQLPSVGSHGGWSLGTWCQVEQRRQCAFCQLVVTAILDSFDRDGKERLDPDQEVSVLIFPGEQSFRLSYPSRLGTRIAFIAEDAAQARGPDTARTPLLTGMDIPRMTSWLQACSEHHGSCSQPQVEMKEEPDTKYPYMRRRSFNESATSNFRVIDVGSGCIRGVALHTRYVTLSYVWGQLPMFKLQKSNFEQLSQEHSLDSFLQDLPNTVGDAIELVKALGERYLWVDGLCLVQNDPDDVTLGISMMNSIYQGSYFTIVAASGADADAGLPGLGRKTEESRRRTQMAGEVAPGIRMTILHSIDWHLSRSTYNERGWTMQEFVSPKRTAIFINGQVYFRCQEANWSEETWADKWNQWLDADDSNISRIPDPVDGFLPSMWSYQKLCEEFSRRKLRNDGDALRALAGVTRPMGAGMQCMMVEGLPGYYLDHFALFVASHGDMRRRDRFASFSWAGWEGQIMWPRENFLWYNEEEDGTVERTRDTAHIFKHLRHNRILAWHALDATAQLEHLSFRPYELPSLLLELMQQFPNVFPPDMTHIDPLRDPLFRRNEIYSSGSGYSGGVPHWDRIPDKFSSGSKWYDSSVETELSGALPTFSLKALDLANGQVELDRLIARMGTTLEKLALMNWMACRNIRVQNALANRTAVGPRPSRNDEAELSRFRNPRDAGLIEGTASFSSKDRRIERGRDKIERQKTGNPASSESRDIPAFPPHVVLAFVTISLHLHLGTVPPQHDQSDHSTYQSPFDRVPGIPLLSKTGQVVGTIHPDNTNLMATAGSTVELLVITRSQTPTVGSALLDLDETKMNRPMKLFWVLHVVWKDGIAERRGVGQILQSALEDAVEPAPCVKPILLG